MAKLVVTGIFTLHPWKINRVSENEWTAWIPDKDKETGAPLLTAIGFEQLIDKINIFEQGGQYASSNN